MNGLALRIVCVAVAVVSHAGCSRPFFVRPVGSFDRGITFQFFDKDSDARPSVVRLTRFAVQRHTGPDQWTTVWELEGSRQAASLDYGQPMTGFEVSGSATPLERDGQYRAWATASFRTGAGSALVFFAFNPDGAVRVTEAVLR